MTATWPGILLLSLVTMQRLIELPVARANARRLQRLGGYEVGSGHYPLIVAIHAAWLGSLWWFAPGNPISLPFLTAFALLEFGRAWIFWSLGQRWTTRIIVVPGEQLVTDGPYRFLRHPNYWVVAGEIAVLPLVFGLWEIALIFSALNAIALTIRIRAENRSLAH